MCARSHGMVHLLPGPFHDRDGRDCHGGGRRVDRRLRRPDILRGTLTDLARVLFCLLTRRLATQPSMSLRAL